MMIDGIRKRSLLPLAVLMSGCGGDGGTGPEAVRDVRVDDPRGDTFGGAASAGFVQPDITSLTLSQEDDQLVLVVEFADRVEASVDGPNAVGGFIDLDTDQNGATGDFAATDRFRPAGTGTTGLGVDAGVIVETDADVRVIDISAGTVRNLRATYAGRTITIRLPYGLIDGDGELNAAAVFGNLPEPTDIVPNAGHVAVGTAAGTRIERGPAARNQEGRTDHAPAWHQGWSPSN